MNRAMEFLADGSITLKEIVSPYNGKLTVKWDMTSGYQIMGGGLWQVGGPVQTVWEESFKELPDDFSPKKLLIVGLGGGTIAKLARKKWPNINMTGVDIDEVIVQLGREYLGLGKLNVQIEIGDAFDFVFSQKQKHDLICVDTYQGSTFPEKFQSDEFLTALKKILEKDGIALFNRLYEGRDRTLADKFEKKLEKFFGNVQAIYPKPHELANAVYLVRK